MRRNYERKMKEDRMLEIVQGACDLAKACGYKNVTLVKLASHLNITHGIILYHFGTISALYDEIMRHSVDNKVLEVIAQGLVDKNPIALSAPKGLKIAAVKLINR